MGLKRLFFLLTRRITLFEARLGQLQRLESRLEWRSALRGMR